GLTVDSHESRVPGNPNVTAGVLCEAVPSELRPRKSVIRPRRRAGVHLSDLQTPSVDVPDVSILAEVCIVESALAIWERWNVVLDEHRLAQRFFIDGLVRNCQPAFLAFRAEVLDHVSDQLLALARSKRTRHQARACVVKWVLH